MQSLVDQCLVEQGNGSHDGSCDSQIPVHAHTLTSSLYSYMKLVILC